MAGLNVTDYVNSYGTGRFQTSDEIFISDMIPMETRIFIPVGTHSMNAIITSDVINGENVFSFCDVSVTSTGSNLDISPGDFTPVLASNGNGSYKVRTLH